MASEESLVLGGLNITDQSTYGLDSIDMPTPKKKQEWAGGGDSDGSALVRDPLFENRTITVRLWVKPQASMNAALDALHALEAKLEEAEELQGGMALVWTPAMSSRSITFYVLSGEVEGIPKTMSGDEAGYFTFSPVITLRFDCKPFGYGAEYEEVAAVQSTLPLQTIVAVGVPGDVDAEARLQVTDKATQDRRHLEWGLEWRYYNAATNLLIDSTSLSTSGFAGATATRTGAYNGASNNVINATLLTTPSVVCGTGVLAHLGSFRVKARVYTSSAAIKARLTWRDGDGPWRSNAFVATAGTSWYEVDLGEISVSAALLGTQKWEGRIEAKGGAGDTIDVDYIELIPLERYGLARGPAVVVPSAPSVFAARDGFNQTAGNASGARTTNGITAITAANPGVITSTAHGLSNGDLVFIEGATGTAGLAVNGYRTVAGVTANTFNVGVNTTGLSYTSGGTISKVGKSLDAGGGWYWGGPVATDFTVDATNHLLQRTATSDAAPGRVLVAAATGSLTNQVAQVALTASTPTNGSQGIMLRYKDANNYVYAVRNFTGSLGGWVIKKTVAGVTTTLYSSVYSAWLATTAWYTLRFSVDSIGNWAAYFGFTPSQLFLIASGSDPDLNSSSGALGSGYPALFDYWGASAATRQYDDFQAWTFSQDVVCSSGRLLEVRSDDCVRQDSTGTYYGRPKTYRGARLFVPPAGDANRSARIAVKMRRNDVAVEPDDQIADNQELRLLLTPRYLSVPT